MTNTFNKNEIYAHNKDYRVNREGVLLNPDGKEVLTSPVGYTPDEEDYLSFLQCGLESFNSKSTKFNLN